MTNTESSKLDLQPLICFFTEDTTPKCFAKLLDELLYDYTTMLVRLQLSDEEDKTIHEKTEEFIYYLKRLKDILPDCVKK